MRSAQVIRMPMKLDDETLMAFADGELDPERTREVEAALAGNAAAQAKVARFRATRELLEAAYPAEPVPAALERRVRTAARAARPRPAALYRRWALPLAAAMALTVGLAAGRLAAPDGADPLAAVLERTPAGTSAVLADGRSVTPVATFRDRSGRWCRAFDATGEGDGTTGAACRETDGTWRLALLVPDRPVAAQGDTYAPAGEEPALGDALIAGLRAGEPLAADAERELIGRGWR
jgi:hypothetical protein